MLALPRKSAVATGWKLPFNLAILFHVLIVVIAIVSPRYFHKKPIVPEFLTVDLINIAAPIPAAAAKQSSPQLKSSPPPVAAQKPKVVKPQKTAPIAPIVEQEMVPQLAPPKAISIKPIKRKIKKKIVPDTSIADAQKAKEKKRKQKEIARQKQQQLLQEARRKKSLADAEEAAANDAVKALKNLLRSDAAVTAATQERTQSGSGQNARSGGGSSNIIESQYQSSIFSSLQEHWALPDIKTWDSSLTAVVIIDIAKSGKIIRHSFEKRSGDRVFDQFVSRTIQESNPLPPIPAAMRVQQYRIGLRFKPGKIQ